MWPFVSAILALVASVAANCPDQDGDFELWSDENTWEHGIPGEDHHVVITKPILLDTQTARLGRVNILDGGRLVFSPSTDDLVKLTARQIRIDADGSLEIGSAACRFEGDAEIMLTGVRTDYGVDPDFGEKFIGVAENGTLEIHGPEKLSWTRLASSLEPKQKAFFRKESIGWSSGIFLFEFDPATGGLIQEQSNLGTADKVGTALDTVSQGSIVWLFKGGHFPGKKYQEVFADIGGLVDTFLGADQGTASVSALANTKDGWSLLVDTSDKTSFSQSVDVYLGKEVDTNGINPAELKMEVGDFSYRVSFSNALGAKGIPNQFNIENLALDYKDNTIELEDDLSSWLVGDEIVIASTDYDHKQAERVTITAIEGQTLSFNHEVKYIHYSGNFHGVDMRAEVGNLNRRIKIHGEIGETCQGGVENKCHLFDEDNWGGHTKAISGFTAYNIEGAEIFAMGQGGKIASYPVHFHMCGAMDKETNPLIANNAIHDTLSRCVVVHGSHGAHIRDNVAFNHYGHCFFTEDGGEKRTVFDHNLGLGTKEGFLTQSDTEPTTFWITSPLTTLTNNVAAGSDNSRGVGIWYLFPDEPVELSKDMFFEYKEAKRTPINEFKNNVAHSNGRFGLAFFERLGEKHTILGCSTYSPRVDPLDKNSEFKAIVLDGFTGYKNRKANGIMRSTAAELNNFFLADSETGMILKRNMLGGYQRIKNSVIVGESPNKGLVPEMSTYKNTNGTSLKYYPDRSQYDNNHGEKQIKGIRIQAEGPSHLHDIQFFNFINNEIRDAVAISWGDQYSFHNGITTSSKGLSFNFKDEEEGSYMYYKNLKQGPGEDTISMIDLDGSLTGEAGNIVLMPGTYFTEGEKDCVAKDSWNLQICKGTYAKMYLWPMVEDSYGTFVTDEEHQIYSAESALNLRVAYTLRQGRTMVLNWNVTMPNTQMVRMSGLEKDEEIIMGHCMPKGLAAWDSCTELLVEMEVKINEAETWDDFVNRKEKNLFFDKEKVILYRKYTEDRTRNPEDLADCQGGLHDKFCPFFRILAGKMEGLDMDDGDCRDR